MTTKTSKKRSWLTSLLLVPVVAVLFYNFVEFKEEIRPSNNLADTTIITPIEIDIKKDSSIYLNKKPVEFWEVARKAKHLTKDLTEQEVQNYVTGSILMPNEQYMYIGNQLIEQLKLVGINSCSASFMESNSKANYRTTHFSPFANQTVEEAEKLKLKLTKDLENAIQDESNKVTSKWQVSYGLSSNNATNHAKDENKAGPYTNLSDPYLHIKSNGDMFLNYQPTSKKRLSEDFDELVNHQKANLILQSELPVHSDEIENLRKLIGENLGTVKVNSKSKPISSPGATDAQVNSYNSWANLMRSKFTSSEKSGIELSESDVQQRQLQNYIYYVIMSPNQRENAVPFPFGLPNTLDNTDIIDEKVITVLINRNNKFLIDDEIGDLMRLKKMLDSSIQKDRVVLILKSDKETSPKVIEEVDALLSSYDNLVVYKSIGNDKD